VSVGRTFGSSSNQVREPSVNEADLREVDLKVAAYLTERVRAENEQSGRTVCRSTTRGV